MKEERMKEPSSFVYNQEAQVSSCAGFMLGEEIEDARIAIVIGHNGINFVSSTDWRLQTWSGMKRVLPFSVRPQYPNFVECVAGVSYSGKREKFTILPDADDAKRGAIVELEGKRYEFLPGTALKIYIEPNSRFIATDCAVVLKDDGVGPRVYKIEPNEETVYAFLDENKRVSQV